MTNLSVRGLFLFLPGPTKCLSWPWLLHSRFSSGYITYHPRAEEVGLSHLMFADDVMIYFDGGSASLHAITETLKEFVGWSEPHCKTTYKIFGITSNA